MTIPAKDMDFTVFCIFDHDAGTVFEAVADPDQLSKHFVMGGAKGRMDAGAVVTWEFADFPGAFVVSVIESVPGQRLVFDWPKNTGTGHNRVTFSFSATEPGRTRVEVSEAGWEPTPGGLQAAYGNVMGWSYMLATMRTWLDHGLAVRPGMFR
ncbi:SRPBCC domain-containing protein [Paracoccus aerodenitrificans]|uniref:SRPBCC domain-containing protein n=1 Tax=Paracoccus aerodenitrificans TaxID=3017781 RepID=UPI0022EFF23B|nr:SRPBCC domain-containing protein [Paracoccus aerodenitrificans]WBU64440.1 SRPBCC domain-containing protein [Paracoccus aerodenitrificans]